MHKSLLSSLILAGCLPLAAAQADAPPQCDLHLIVHLTPDVPDPAASGFLSSLLTNPNYRLNLLGKVGDRDVAMELSGPGAPAACTQIIDGMRRDARIVSIEIQGGVV